MTHGRVTDAEAGARKAGAKAEAEANQPLPQVQMPNKPSCGTGRRAENGAATGLENRSTTGLGDGVMVDPDGRHRARELISYLEN